MIIAVIRLAGAGDRADFLAGAGGVGPFSDGGRRGEQNGDEDHNDPDHHQELDERKTGASAAPGHRASRPCWGRKTRGIFDIEAAHKLLYRSHGRDARATGNAPSGAHFLVACELMPLISEIIGMNSAMTMNPTITPSTTTMTGSRMLISELTSTSTSLS